MAQARYFDYGFTLTSDAYAFLLSQTFVPGVYQGLDISQGATRDEVVIAPGTVLLDDGVVVNENQPQSIRFSVATSQSYLVVVRHKLQHVVGGTPADFAVIKADDLQGWTAGYSYYVIGSITIRAMPPSSVYVTYSSAEKIRDRLAEIIQNFVASSISQSFVAPLVGNRGPQGFQGWQGWQGLQGNQGPQGNQGNQGNDGAGGGAGAQGNQGNQGNDGAGGGSGTQGFQGVQGLPGLGAYYTRDLKVNFNSVGGTFNAADGWVSTLVGTSVSMTPLSFSYFLIRATISGTCDTAGAQVAARVLIDGTTGNDTGRATTTVSDAGGNFSLTINAYAYFGVSPGPQTVETQLKVSVGNCSVIPTTDDTNVSTLIVEDVLQVV